MKTFDELTLVNYCHPDCQPLLNIMRLPEKEAYALAGQMAASHPETMAFYRFADFHNYYPLRMQQDMYLRRRFVELGGQPEEEHPLSFTVEDSDYLQKWFDGGIETRLKLRQIAPCHISFTVGDSGSNYQRDGALDVLTLDMLRKRVAAFGDDFSAFLQSTGRGYVEAQLWSDRYIR